MSALDKIYWFVNIGLHVRIDVFVKFNKVVL